MSGSPEAFCVCACVYTVLWREDDIVQLFSVDSDSLIWDVSQRNLFVSLLLTRTPKNCAASSLMDLDCAKENILKNPLHAIQHLT